jgi:hypothetical protein
MVEHWEMGNRMTLSRLAFLLKRIIAVAKESAGKVTIVKRDAGSRLKIVVCGQKIALLKDLYEKLKGETKVSVRKTRLD